MATQKIAYNNFMIHLFPSDLSTILTSRVCAICQENLSASIDPAILILRQLKKYECVHVIKTWANSWSTSHRFHEPVRYSCLFGCTDARDSLQHYVRCETLWSLVCRVLRKPENWEPIRLLGIQHPSAEGLRAISAVFYAYHAMKFRASEYVIHTPTSSDPGIGASMPHTDTPSQAQPSVTSLVAVDADVSCSIFVGALKAAAMTSGLLAPAPLSEGESPLDDIAVFSS